MRKDIYAIITKHVNNWDPEKLLLVGEPGGEYQTEINQLCHALPRIDNVFELSKKVKVIFESSYQIEYDANACFMLAEKIWAEIT
ncbi:protein of unknown function [Evansella caseinilytica]|uniref:Uncharacterized protein n=1 Tax=Evansella caseinilytica TaxID=1503961 RepID=A0A1H3J0L3_9BACI|nr:DUF1871 family protein [Evansella caseinilytica]SDY33347.1 protein of unknown function [Evansella caseinilytica]